MYSWAGLWLIYGIYIIHLRRADISWGEGIYQEEELHTMQLAWEVGISLGFRRRPKRRPVGFRSAQRAEVTSFATTQSLPQTYQVSQFFL